MSSLKDFNSPMPHFPPVTREEFNDYYSALMDRGVDYQQLPRQLVKDMLSRGGIGDKEADVAVKIVVPALYRQGESIRPQEIAPFKKAFRAMINPPDTRDTEAVVRAADMVMGLSRLRHMKAIDPALSDDEQKLVLIMMAAAQEMHLQDKRSGAKPVDWRGQLRESNRHDIGMN